MLVLLDVLVLGEEVEHTGGGGHGIDLLQLTPSGRDLTEMVTVGHSKVKFGLN